MNIFTLKLQFQNRIHVNLLNFNLVWLLEFISVIKKTEFVACNVCHSVCLRQSNHFTLSMWSCVVARGWAWLPLCFDDVLPSSGDVEDC